MVRYTCDGCGTPLSERGLRYSVTIDVRAVYDEAEVGLVELVRDHRAELLALIERLRAAEQTAEELEETIYKALHLDLCARCQQVFIRKPLRFSPDAGVHDDEIDITGFLRSLGHGKEPEIPPESPGAQE